ncbi:MAG: Hemolysin-type calcium-binding region [Pedosphaera sp.]|nr:Hemolysin-type calcium-binding region [Pedosphaera sp.]
MKERMVSEANYKFSLIGLATLQRAIVVVLLTGAFLWLPDNARGAGCAVAPPGLISWWRAENDATDVVAANQGTLIGGTAYASGEVGQAFSFNGVNGQVQVPNALGLNFNFNSPVTIELWAYRTGGQTSMQLAGKRVVGCGALQYEMSFDPYGGLAFYGGNGSVQTGLPMPTNTWIHLTGTFDGTNTFRFYTNGVLAGTGSGNLGAANGGPFSIGTSGGCSYFAGLIDEVSLYSRCLAASEIQSLYSAGASGKCFTPPSITNQPQPAVQTLLAGESTQWTVGAVGSTPLKYQWLRNGTNISGATNNPLVLTNLQPNQSGTYSVVISNYAGSVTSSNAALTVVAPVPGQVVVADQAGLLAGLSSGGNVTAAVDGPVYLSQTLTITHDVTLDASGHSFGISGSNSVRAFYVNPGVHLRLINLSISNGVYAPINVTNAYAGAIYNDHGTVDLVNCALVGNSCTGGPYYNGPSTNGYPAFGGAIFNDGGVLNITNSSFQANRVAGGGAQGNSDYNGGTGGSVYGGAIYNSGGVVNASGSSFTGNSGLAGAILGVPGPCGSAYGGALYTTAGAVTVVNCSFNSNSIDGFFSDYYHPGQAAGGAICQNSGTMLLKGVAFATNTASGGKVGPFGNSPSGDCSGGAIFNAGTLRATNCAFLGNMAYGTSSFNGASALGGAVHNRGDASLEAATFAGNKAIGGKCLNQFGSYRILGHGRGGGLFNSNTIVLVNSAFYSNSAFGGDCFTGNTGGSGFGGAVYTLGSLYATNDTMAQNLAQGGLANNPPFHAGNGNGGGLFNQGGSVILDYQTIASNNVFGFVGVGGGINTTNGNLLLLNSIVANNGSGGDIYSSFASLTDGGDNIGSDISFPFTAAGSLNNTDPKLGPLGNNGGPTQTMPLLAGSPAIDAAGAGDFLAVDQRGLQRPSGATRDIGAFELQYVSTYVVSGVVSGAGLSGETLLSIGSSVVTTHNHGYYEYALTNAGTYSITPLDTNYMFAPSSISVTVGPGQSGLNFTAFPWNGLTFQNSTGGFLRFRFLSQNAGQSFRTLESSNLVDWKPIATNVMGVSNYFDLAIPITNGVNRFYRTVIP